MKRVALFSCVFLLAVATVGLPAQQAPTFRSSTQTVPIYATVVDSAGRLVPDLVEEHFEVFDNGKLQPLTLFKSDIQPITVVVMLDTSGSMTFNFEFLKQAAEQFVLRLLPADRARIGSFSDKIIVSPAFTSDRDSLLRVLHNDIQYGNPTRLWDAIDESMSALAHEEGRRVVLIFTDGDDQKSRNVGFDQVVARAQDQNYMIYAIGLRSRIMGQVTKPDRNLRGLADQTGGGYFELTRTADLNSTFTRVADELHRQYVMAFAPDRLDGLVHKLDVRVKVPGMVVRARKTYLADGGGAKAPPKR
ncbi:MAG: VWA domain-containing protein [Vicinamibacterales bacterium]